MDRSRAIAVYVTGHGFGHAVRVAEVLRVLLARRSDVIVHLRTSVPAWLFPAAKGRLVVHPVETDVGVCQPNALVTDLPGTLERLDGFAASWAARRDREIAWIRELGPRLVLGDIPPIAFVTASAAGVPSLALGNFSWDWVYRSYLPHDPRFGMHAESAASCYRQADGLLRLPFHGEMIPFRRVTDLPLIVRRSPLSRREARAALGFSLEGPLVLLSFGGIGFSEVSFEGLARIPEIQFLTTETCLGAASNVRKVERPKIDYTTLLRACDAVVTRPGYGIVSASLANGVRVLYTSRGEFPEYPILAAALERHGTACHVPPEAIRSGDFGEALRELLSRTVGEASLETHGAERAAEAIEEWL